MAFSACYASSLGRPLVFSQVLSTAGAGPGDRERVALGVHCSALSAVGLALSPGLGSAPSAALVRTLITAVPCLPSRTVLSCDGGDLLRWPATPRFLGGLDGGRVFRVEIALSAHVKLMGFNEGNKARDNRAESSRRGMGVLSEMLSTLQSLYNNLGGDPPTEGITIQSR